MASERAKQLAAEQKAAVKAEKLRKKKSDDPKDWGTIRQVWETFKVQRKDDKALVWLMLGAFLVVVAIFTVIGVLFLHPWEVYLVFGIIFGVLAAALVLLLRARSGLYKKYKGQPGSGEVALSMLPKGWVKYPAIAVNRYQDVVHRAVGPAGIVLIGEGAAGRVREMLATETKRHESIKYAVPVTTVVMGDAPNQVPLAKLAKYIRKLPKAIKPSQVTEVQARLKALDASRPRIPLPKGPLPSMKGARAALRGR